jgi:hypothetical protein
MYPSSEKVTISGLGDEPVNRRTVYKTLRRGKEAGIDKLGRDLDLARSGNRERHALAANLAQIRHTFWCDEHKANNGRVAAQEKTRRKLGRIDIVWCGSIMNPQACRGNDR